MPAARKKSDLFMRTLKQLKKIDGKRVLVRVDFNVPVKNKKVLDNSKILAALPTIKFLIGKNAKVILVSHFGRPKGKIDRSMRMDPMADHLGVLLNKDIKKFETRDWKLSQKDKEYFKKQIEMMSPGQVAMLENIRFSPDEKNNKGALAKDLAALADMFVLDGFGVAHRADASVVGVAKYLPSYAGFLLENEVKGLEKVLKKPRKPFVLVLGGIKVETKAPVAKYLMPKVDNILVGGAIFNTYLKAQKYKVGESVVDDVDVAESMKCCRNKKVILPMDLVVGQKNGKNFRVVELQAKPHQVCKKGEAIFDIGPRTIRLYAKYIKKAGTVVWNGAMGYFEQAPYNTGTLSVARLVASRAKGRAYGVIGGGETLQAMELKL